MYNLRTWSVMTVLLISSSFLFAQNSRDFEYQRTYQDIANHGEYPIPTWEESRLVGTQADQLTLIQVELAQSLDMLQSQVTTLEVIISELEETNQSIEKSRVTWANQLELLVAENDALLESMTGFDPITEEVVAANRARMQDLEQALRSSADELSRNQYKIQRHWLIINDHERNILRHEEIMNACQQLIAMQED